MMYRKFIDKKIDVYLKSGNVVSGIAMGVDEESLMLGRGTSNFFIELDNIDFIGIDNAAAAPLPRPAKEHLYSRPNQPSQIDSVKPPQPRAVRPSQPENGVPVDREEPYTFRGIKLPRTPEEAWELNKKNDSAPTSSLPANLLEEEEPARYDKPGGDFGVTFSTNLGG